MLSGFLITCLLVQEWRRQGSFSLKRFYWRRVLRSFQRCLWRWPPGLLGRCLKGVIASRLPGRCSAWQLTAPTSSLLFADWAAGGVRSLLVAFGRGTVLFDLADSPLAFASEGSSTRQIACLLLAALAAVNVYRPFLWSGHDSWVRLYFGPDTHADPILVGCALALLVDGKQVVLVGSKAVALAVLSVGIRRYASLGWLIASATKSHSYTAAGSH